MLVKTGCGAWQPDKRFSLISRRGRYALTDVFGALEPRSRAVGFDEHGSPAASLDDIEAYLEEER